MDYKTRGLILIFLFIQRLVMKKLRFNAFRLPNCFTFEPIHQMNGKIRTFCGNYNDNFHLTKGRNIPYYVKGKVSSSRWPKRFFSFYQVYQKRKRGNHILVGQDEPLNTLYNTPPIQSFIHFRENARKSSCQRVPKTLVDVGWSKLKKPNFLVSDFIIFRLLSS